MNSTNFGPKGYVYILINISMPGLIKVGKSTRSPEIRASELSQASGVPQSFQIVYQTLVDNCDLAEKEVHKFLSPFRENSNREFFRIPLNRAIDVLRKVIAENNLKESDFDNDPYKFSYEEFHSAEALFEKVISHENYWEQAKLHFKSGYVLSWLKKKAEYHALVNADLYIERKDDLDFYLSLMVYSVLPSEFNCFGYKIKSRRCLFDYYKEDYVNDGPFLKLLLQGNFLSIYEGYLCAKGIGDDDVVKSIKFINSTKGLPYEDRKRKHGLVLKWTLESERYLYISSINYFKVKYLKNADEWSIQTKGFIIPKEIIAKGNCKNEDHVIEAIKYLEKVRDICKEKQIPLKDSNTLDIPSLIPNQRLLEEIAKLTPQEYLKFLEIV